MAKCRARVSAPYVSADYESGSPSLAPSFSESVNCVFQAQPGTAKPGSRSYSVSPNQRHNLSRAVPLLLIPASWHLPSEVPLQSQDIMDSASNSMCWGSVASLSYGRGDRSTIGECLSEVTMLAGGSGRI